MTARASCRVLRGLGGDSRGAVLIETAIVAPVLILLALGSFDVGCMVTRQLELQGGVAEAEAIVLAAGAGASTDTTELAAQMKSSLSLADDEVSVTKTYRCNADEGFVTVISECAENAVISSYVKIALRDEYVPMWTNFGVSKTFSYNVTRTVQLGTEQHPVPTEPA